MKIILLLVTLLYGSFVLEASNTDSKDNAPKQSHPGEQAVDEEGINADIGDVTKIDSKSCRVILGREDHIKKEYNGEIWKFIEQLDIAFKASDGKPLSKLFHKRLKVDHKQAYSVIRKTERILGGNIRLSPFEVYEIKSKNSEAEYVDCKTSRLSILSQYGHPLQFGVIMQILGEKELGKLFFHLVPESNSDTESKTLNLFKPVLGSFHIWKWTYGEKNYQDWFKKGQAFPDTEPWKKITHFEMALKLLDSEPYVKIWDRQYIAEKRQEIATNEDFRSHIAEMFGAKKLKYVGTILEEEGLALIVRLETDRELSSDVTRENCNKYAKALFDSPNFNLFEGFRCGYNFGRESFAKDGILGSVYIAKSEFLKKGSH